MQATPPVNGQPSTIKDILNLDIEQLGKVDVHTPSMNLEVTSVSKQESTVGRSPAAIYVITSEMIARSACNNIPDLLRLVPGLDVARINASTWAIASRGFNNRYAADLLVLVDGRTVYTPQFSGVFWDVQDMLLEDIERIEVIRGPGGTIWGANAVNGVINIITKRAKDTQGTLVTYGGGNEDLALGGFRVGRTVGEDLHYRIYGKHKEEAGGYDPTGLVHDDWRQGRAGFRADWEPDRGKTNVLTVQGDYYVGREGVYGDLAQPTDPFETTFSEDDAPTGGNVLARWTHIYNDDSDWSLQTYFDRFQRAYSFWRTNVSTFDVEFQHRFPLGERHKIIWGSDYRLIHDDEASDGFAFNWDPEHRTTGMFSMFVQDEIALVEDRFFFTVGSKFEHNDYTGFDYQPSGRILYTPDNKHSFWAAISRAVRIPSRFEQDGWFTFTPTPLPPPYDRAFGRLIGNPNTGPENLVAYEIGYRAQPEERFSYDITAFYNVYENQPGFLVGQMEPDAYGNLIVPYHYDFGARAQSQGVELTGQWAVSERWRLSTSYTFLNIQMIAHSDVVPYYTSGGSPRNQVQFASAWDLGRQWQFDMDLRYVDNLPDLGVPSYLTMDLRLAWQPNKRFEFAVIGRNLFDDHQLEFVEVPHAAFYGTEVLRSVFGKVTWRY